MSQIQALIWLNWTIFRHTLRSRKAAQGRAASALVIFAAIAFSLLVSTGVAVVAYLLASNAKLVIQQAALCALLFFVYLMWATLPLSTGGGERFDPGRLLIYPISLPKLFVIDVLGALTTIFAIFAAPAILAVFVGVGLAKGNLAWAVPLGFAAVLFGVAVAKGVAAAMGALSLKGRARGETIVALIGIALGFSGALLGQLMPRLKELTDLPWYMRWTPPGALAVALTDGLAPGGLTHYAIGISFTLGVAFALLLFTYRAALRAVYRANANHTRRPPKERTAAYSGWSLPFLSVETVAVAEKELRYAARNAQLRALALTPIVLLVTFHMLGSDADVSGLSGLKKIASAAQGAGGVFYVFVILSPLSANLFGYEGAGMRTLILAPIERRKILVGKNIALALIALMLTALVLAFNGFVLGSLAPGALLFAALCFAFFTPAFALLGNELSMRFPQRLEFGKRLNASGMAGLLLIPMFAMMLVPPGAAVLAGYFVGSDPLRYVTIALFAIGAIALYPFAVNRQGRVLQKRELEILDTLTERNGEG